MKNFSSKQLNMEQRNIKNSNRIKLTKKRIEITKALIEISKSVDEVDEIFFNIGMTKVEEKIDRLYEWFDLELPFRINGHNISEEEKLRINYINIVSSIINNKS